MSPTLITRSFSVAPFHKAKEHSKIRKARRRCGIQRCSIDKGSGAVLVHTKVAHVRICGLHRSSIREAGNSIEPCALVYKRRDPKDSVNAPTGRLGDSRTPDAENMKKIMSEQQITNANSSDLEGDSGHDRARRDPETQRRSKETANQYASFGNRSDSWTKDRRYEFPLLAL